MIHVARTRPGIWLGASLALLLLCEVAPIAQSQTVVPQGLIMGRVVDGTSGAGVAGAVVTISLPAPPGQAAGPASATRPSILTDAEGRFVISSLPAGRITLLVNARGYLQQPSG